MTDQQSDAIRGFQSFADYLGYHRTTIIGWHKKILPIPLTKTGSKKNHPVTCSKTILKEWYQKIISLR